MTGFDDQTANITLTTTTTAPRPTPTPAPTTTTRTHHTTSTTTTHGTTTATTTPTATSSTAATAASHEVTVRFHPKHTFSTKNNPICGITLRPWLSILWSFFSTVEWVYYPRVLFISLLAVVNSCLGWVEWWVYGAAIERQELPTDPIFIIGHPRTGKQYISQRSR
jgi:hypothetical protein